MEDEASKYQLRRMVLVNAGTNKHVPSNRITEIAPRGGAAVLGDNGVGKNTLPFTRCGISAEVPGIWRRLD